MLRAKVSGLEKPNVRETIKRVAGLLASIDGIEFDEDSGEVHFLGDPDKHLLLVSLSNEGIEARPVSDAPRHTLERSAPDKPRGIDLASIPSPDPAGLGEGLPSSLDPAVKG